MKVILRALPLLLACSTLARAEVVWDKPVQFFHRVPEDKKITATFTFTNKDAQPFTIRRVKTSCGCTTAKPSKDTFAPGESGQIEVTYTFGFQRGLHQKGVVITAEDKREWQLVLQCDIGEPLAITPSLVWWKVGDAAATKTVQLHTPDGQKVGVKSVTSSNPKIAAKLETLAPGKDYAIHITPTDTAAKDSAELTIATDFPPDQPRSYKVFARIK